MKNKELFERCYQIYPKSRRDRGKSEKAWIKLDPDESEAKDIFERILAWNKYWQASGTEQRFIKHFSVWLNNCTRDDIPSMQEAKETKNAQGMPTCRDCGSPVVIRFTYCESCQKKYQKEAQNTAEDYCTQNGLYIRGQTSRGQAKENMMKHIGKLLGNSGILPWIKK